MRAQVWQRSAGGTALSCLRHAARICLVDMPIISVSIITFRLGIGSEDCGENIKSGFGFCFRSSAAQDHHIFQWRVDAV